ncbi:exopolyphosphatase [Selenomonas sp. TAMA-11512]|uniref:Ppx/GppA phosphatase family protein n=1 Tax=Selenomonas sp. TAMA-11512 TaxID=3095337 RepID=UPI003084B768|nr:exopolyphosphatase [Selenomonas sp. TAMA-11512]
MEHVAVIDMGSNSIRFMVMRIEDNASFSLQYQQNEAIRLGKGMRRTGRLNLEGVERAVECLRVYSDLIKVMEVDHVIAVATAAARSAKDGDAFIRRIREETGIEVEVISGEREAYLGYLGVVNTIAADDYIQFDLGGASIEVSLVRDRRIEKSVSVPIGTVTLTDQFALHGTVTPVDMEKCTKFIERAFKESIPWAKGKRLPVIGVGGTVRTLAKMDMSKVRYQLSRIHNYVIPYNRFNDTYQALIKSSYGSRKKIRGLSPERADIIAGGAAIIRALLRFSGGRDIIVSGCGLRDGAFYEYYGEKYGNGSPVVEDVLNFSVQNYLLRTNRRMGHLELVHRLTGSLFEQLPKLHGADKRAGEILSIAAWLHDAGKIINYYDHARHSAFIIGHAPLYGMTHREQLMAAYIAGFHHGISNKTVRSYRYSMMLSQEEWKTVRRLSLLLAIAEAADVTYEGFVERLEAEERADAVVLHLLTKDGKHNHRAADLEIQSVAKQCKAEMGKPLVVVWD